MSVQPTFAVYQDRVVATFNNVMLRGTCFLANEPELVGKIFDTIRINFTNNTSPANNPFNFQFYAYQNNQSCSVTPVNGGVISFTAGGGTRQGDFYPSSIVLFPNTNSSFKIEITDIGTEQALTLQTITFYFIETNGGGNGGNGENGNGGNGENGENGNGGNGENGENGNGGNGENGGNGNNGNGNGQIVTSKINWTLLICLLIFIIIILLIAVIIKYMGEN